METRETAIAENETRLKGRMAEADQRLEKNEREKRIERYNAAE